MRILNCNAASQGAFPEFNQGSPTSDEGQSNEESEKSARARSFCSSIAVKALEATAKAQQEKLEFGREKDNKHRDTKRPRGLMVVRHVKKEPELWDRNVSQRKRMQSGTPTTWAGHKALTQAVKSRRHRRPVKSETWNSPSRGWRNQAWLSFQVTGNSSTIGRCNSTYSSIRWECHPRLRCWCWRILFLGSPWRSWKT